MQAAGHRQQQQEIADIEQQDPVESEGLDGFQRRLKPKP